MRALGTIIEAGNFVLTENEFTNGLLDYHDHWNSIDPRLAPHHTHLSRASEIFGHDLINLATYTHLILAQLPPARLREHQALVIVSGMAEAFLISVRSACDAVAQALAYAGAVKPGQVPIDGLRALLEWAPKNPHRLHPAVLAVLQADFAWFWKLRTLRDHLVHNGALANIHTDGRQFNLWLRTPTDWISREPLLPLLVLQLDGLTRFAGHASAAINSLIDFPADRCGSRVISGVLVPALHELRSIAGDYGSPSP